MKRIILGLVFVIGALSYPANAEIISHKWDGNTYVGEVKDGNLHGQGKYIGADGMIYEGQWRHNKFHGQGTLIMPDGNKYVGEFKDNNAWEVVVYTGSGTVAGTFEQGQWCNGCQPKKATGTGATASSLFGALTNAAKQAKKNNQAGGASASSLLGALTGASSQGSGTQQTASVSSTNSGDSGSMADKMYEMYAKYPRGAATRYAQGKMEIQKMLDEGIPFLPANHPTVQYLQKVLTVVAIYSRRPITYTGRYTIVIGDDPDPNAFAGPGGTIYVATGMLDLLDNEDELAFLLAHELAHVELDHGYTLLMDISAAKMYAEQTGIDVNSIWTEDRKDEANSYREIEADERALELIAMAGYNPSVAMRVAKQIKATGHTGYDNTSGSGFSGNPMHDKDRVGRIAEQIKMVTKKIPYRDAGGFELRKKRFGTNLGREVQAVSSSESSGSKKKKSKSASDDR